MLSLVVLSGCREVKVAEELTQRQATEIVAILNSSGVAAEASRETGSGSKYTVVVDSEHYVNAVSILHQRGLPGERQPTFQELVEQRGFIPNSREVEALRLDYARAINIQEALLEYPPVATAKVLLNLEARKAGEAPGVSIVVQKRAGKEIDKERITEIVGKIMPSIASQDISILESEELKNSTQDPSAAVYFKDGKVTYAPLVSFLPGWRVPQSQYNRAVVIFCVVLLAAIIIGLFIGYWYHWYQRTKQGARIQGLPEVRANRPRIEGPLIKESEG